VEECEWMDETLHIAIRNDINATEARQRFRTGVLETMKFGMHGRFLEMNPHRSGRRDRTRWLIARQPAKCDAGKQVERQGPAMGTDMVVKTAVRPWGRINRTGRHVKAAGQRRFR